MKPIRISNQDTGGSYAELSDNTVWPSKHQKELEWELRHGSPQQVVENRMRAASVIEAYRALLDMPQTRRNEVCRAICEIGGSDAQRKGS